LLLLLLLLFDECSYSFNIMNSYSSQQSESLGK